VVMVAEMFEWVLREKANMDIIGRDSFDLRGLGGRVYFHGYGFDFYGPEHNAIAHLKSTIVDNINLFSEADYALAIMWAEEGDIFVDSFKYSGARENWGSNQEVVSYVFKNGIYAPHMEAISCGHGMRVVGREGDYREATGSLEDFLKISPPAEILFSNPFLNK
jgi:hypothetical protein